LGFYLDIGIGGGSKKAVLLKVLAKDPKYGFVGAGLAKTNMSVPNKKLYIIVGEILEGNNNPQLKVMGLKLLKEMKNKLTSEQYKKIKSILA
jgi:hypothetical protein